MKQTLIFFLSILSVCLYSCSSEDLYNIECSESQNNNEYKLAEGEAIKIALSYFNHKNSRSSSSQLKVGYITEQIRNRAQNINDTTAYVIN